MASTLFEDLGGERALRPIIDRFVDRVFDDVMIGFFFRNARRERVKAKEYEFAAKHLGAEIEYTGRPLDEAHRAHPIMGGQFARRLMILKETLEAAQVPEHVKQHWLAHTESLRPLITADSGRECDADRARSRVESPSNAARPSRKVP
jgi:hemoglobin